MGNCRRYSALAVPSYFFIVTYCFFCYDFSGTRRMSTCSFRNIHKKDFVVSTLSKSAGLIRNALAGAERKSPRKQNRCWSSDFRGQSYRECRGCVGLHLKKNLLFFEECLWACGEGQSVTVTVTVQKTATPLIWPFKTGSEEVKGG